MHVQTLQVKIFRVASCQQKTNSYSVVTKHNKKNVLKMYCVFDTFEIIFNSIKFACAYQLCNIGFYQTHKHAPGHFMLSFQY